MCSRSSCFKDRAAGHVADRCHVTCTPRPLLAMEIKVSKTHEQTRMRRQGRWASWLRSARCSAARLASSVSTNTPTDWCASRSPNVPAHAFSHSCFTLPCLAALDLHGSQNVRHCAAPAPAAQQLSDCTCSCVLSFLLHTAMCSCLESAWKPKCEAMCGVRAPGACAEGGSRHRDNQLP